MHENEGPFDVIADDTVKTLEVVEEALEGCVALTVVDVRVWVGCVWRRVETKEVVW